MSKPLPETRCPLCGGDNGCAPAASGTFESPCWCATADFPPELLERIAAADRGRSCLCARCAASSVEQIPVDAMGPGVDRAGDDRDGDDRVGDDRVGDDMVGDESGFDDSAADDRTTVSPLRRQEDE